MSGARCAQRIANERPAVDRFRLTAIYIPDQVDEALRDLVRAREDAVGAARRAKLQLRRMAPAVRAFQALRGVSFVTAVTLATELGDVARFANPKELMAYVGLVPSQRSSGPHTRHGRITKAGNTHARRVLVEAAWAYRLHARVGPELEKRSQGLPKAVRDIAWKAQLRLCNRFRRLQARGKEKQKIVTAVARELCGFVWAIANEVELARR